MCATRNRFSLQFRNTTFIFLVGSRYWILPVCRVRLITRRFLPLLSTLVNHTKTKYGAEPVVFCMISRDSGMQCSGFVILVWCENSKCRLDELHHRLQTVRYTPLQVSAHRARSVCDLFFTVARKPQFSLPGKLRQETPFFVQNYTPNFNTLPPSGNFLQSSSSTSTEIFTNPQIWNTLPCNPEPLARFQPNPQSVSQPVGNPIARSTHPCGITVLTVWTGGTGLSKIFTHEADTFSSSFTLCLFYGKR